ncbi:hypothetical protein L195_g064643, partial [Trifolium pratense]
SSFRLGVAGMYGSNGNGVLDD